MNHFIIMIIITCIIGFAISWSVGANDLANIVSTSIGSKSVSKKQILLIVVIFEFAGALLGGSHIVNTLSNSIFNINILQIHYSQINLAMFSVMTASASWMIFASIFGLPASITQTIIGSIIGFIVFTFGIQAINWKILLFILSSWMIAPLFAMILSAVLFKLIKITVLTNRYPAKQMRIFFPIYLLFAISLLSSTLVLKIILHFDLTYSNHIKIILILILIISSTLLIINRVKIIKNSTKNMNRHKQYKYVESLFSILTIISSCSMIFAHGANDVAVTISPIAILFNNGLHLFFDQYSFIIIALITCGILLGLFTYGKKIIYSIGSGITALTPSRAFIANISSSFIVILANSMGIPVSATQTLVGGILGVGISKGLFAINLKLVRNILLSWLITLPITAILSGIYFSLLKFIIMQFFS